jgi:lactosylceramide 4-alpha-galactosyltransferase
MWTLGGMYMDTDMVITKLFDGLDQAVRFQDRHHAFLNCAMIIFKEPGSPSIWKCMEEVAVHYNGVVWGANGPMLLTQVWRGWRNSKELIRIIRVQDQPKFYMFYHRDAKHHCFDNSMTGEQRLAYAKTLATNVPYAVHMSNKMTWLVKKDLIPGTFCHYLFTRYCVFCDAYPPKPQSYPAIDEVGEHVELP